MCFDFSVTMVVSFTDFNKMALLYFCTKHKFGKTVACEADATDVIIMSRAERPNDRDVRSYHDRAIKRLCGKRKDYISCKSGMTYVKVICYKNNSDQQRWSR